MANERSTADRNLLFAIMAAQVHLVERTVVVAALRAWVLDRSQWIGQILINLAALNADQHDALMQIVDLHINAHGGDPLKSLERLSETTEALALISELSPEEQIGVAGLLVPVVGPPKGQSPPTAVDVDPTWAARFRKRSDVPFTQGGLGALYEADDLEIGRRIAVKELQSNNRADQVARRRLRFEAEVTGRLEHPNIIPIYGRGTRADGDPYYAMKLLPTPRTLADLIRDYHSAPNRSVTSADRILAFRDLLSKLVAVCDAVEYAHSRGILHRDLKPANVLVGEFGETLVADWGLAKFVGAPEPDPSERDSSNNDPVMSHSGTALTGGLPGFLGTPAYAPPEQARGDREMGPAADVYALGAILYEILTGQHRFVEIAVDGINREDLIARIETGRFPAPREVDPKVDRALEAICLKALATDPVDRYRTVKALRQDVDRWIADEAIAAHRDPLMAKLRRWGRKHRTLATTAAMLLLATLVGLSLGLRRERWNAIRLAQEQQESDRWLNQAFDAIEGYFTGVAEEAIRGAGLSRSLREKLTDEPRKFLEKIAAEVANKERPTEREQYLLARTQTQLGRLLIILARPKDATSNFEAAAGQWRRLVKSHPLNLEYAEGLAGTLSNQATGMMHLNEVGPAIEMFKEAAEIVGELGQRQSNQVEIRDRLAKIQNNLGLAFGRRDEVDLALDCYSKAIAIRDRLLLSDPDNLSYLRGLRGSYNNRADLLVRQREFEAATTDIQRAITLSTRIVGSKDSEPDDQDALASLHSSFGIILRLTKRFEEAAFQQDIAIRKARALAAAWPNVPIYEYSIALWMSNLGNVYSDMKRWEEAASIHRDAIPILTNLLQRYPQRPDFEEALAMTYMNLANELSVLGQHNEAIAKLTNAVEIRKGLAKRYPDVIRTITQLAIAQGNLAIALAGAGRHSEAIAVSIQAIEILSEGLKNNPESGEYRARLVDCYGNLSISQRFVGRIDEALDSAIASIELIEDDPEALYDAACRLSLCIRHLSNTSSMSRTEATDVLMDTLRKVVKLGWDDGHRLANEPDLLLLHSRADFDGLLGVLFDRRFPAQVFAGESDASRR